MTARSIQISVATLAVIICCVSARGETRPAFETYALELPATNLQESLEFYREIVGFRRLDDAQTEGWALLALDKMRLVLREDQEAVASPADSVGLNLYVDDLDATIAKWRAKGVRFKTEKPKAFAIGNTILFDDPAGNRCDLLNVSKFPVPPAKRPRLFNIGLVFDDLLAAEPLFANYLGISVSTRAYLPETLVLDQIGSFPLVLHARETATDATSRPEAARPCIVLAAPDLAAARSALAARGIAIESAAPESFWHIPSFTFSGAEGHAFRVAQVPAFAIPPRKNAKAVHTINDLAWIAGSWTRTDGSDILRETWSKPLGGQMMGMFQWIKGYKTWINELCTIGEIDGEIAFRLRHFSDAMVGWEEKDAPLYYPLRSIEGRTAIFENPMRNSPRQFVFTRTGAKTLQIELVGYKNGEETDRSEFRYHSAD